MSHPTWVRGLKLSGVQQQSIGSGVAPYVGAWIETKIRSRSRRVVECRTLRGCVD